MTVIADFEMTAHAVERALDMCVDPEEIRQCLLHPETVTRSHKYSGYNYRAGRITCAVGDDNKVVTVVWSCADGWREDITSHGSYGEREYRG